MLAKKVSKLLMISGLFAVATQANATVPAGAQFSLGLEGSYIKALNKSGQQYGINASAGYSFSNHFFINAKLHTNGGKVGKLNTGTATVQFLLGYHIPVDACVTLSPFTGLASDAIVVKKNGVKVSSALSYIPLGLKATIDTSKTGQLEFTAEYDWQVGGEFKISGKNANHQKKDIHSNKFNGFKGEALYVHKFNSQSSLAFGPYVNTWRAKNHVVGKALNYTEVGARVVYRFY